MVSARSSGRLRLLGHDRDDIEIISAALQDAIVRVGDINWHRGKRRLTLQLQRYRWEIAETDGPGERVASVLSIEDVMTVRSRHFDRSNPDAFLSVLTVATVEPEASDGIDQLLITLSGGGEMAVDVEAIDVLLADTSDPRPALSRPVHDWRADESP